MVCDTGGESSRELAGLLGLSLLSAILAFHPPRPEIAPRSSPALPLPLGEGRVRASPEGGRLAIIVLTGAEDPALEADLIEGGADDYLQKPLDPRLFLARVAATLRRAGPGSS